MSLFFGWYIVAATVVWTAYYSAMFVYGFTAFLTPISATLGWTYAQISLASSIRGLEIGALDPIAGMVVDRWPARKLMFIGTIIFAVGALVISQGNNLAVFYVGFLVAGLGSAFCHNMVPMTVIARWFRKNIGKASGILYMGYAIGGLFVPLIVRAIDNYGWQDVMMYLAFGALILGLPLSFAFRNRPEEYGLLPDGRQPDKEENPGTGDSGHSLKEAFRTKTFWILGLVGTFQITAVHAVTVHTVPYLTSLGMDRPTAAVSVTIISVIGLFIRVVYGILADKFPKKYIYAFSNAITTVALLLFGYLDGNSFAMMALFSVVYGLGVSGAMLLRVPITREYFGVKSFGAIYGMLSVFTVIGGVTGAPLAGWVYDTHEMYFPIWYIFAGLTIVSTFLLLLLPSSSGKENHVIG